MPTVSICEAKSNLCNLVEAIDTGSEAEVIIARDGRPVARLVPIQAIGHRQRLGVASGAFVVPETIDAENETVEGLYGPSAR